MEVGGGDLQGSEHEAGGLAFDLAGGLADFKRETGDGCPSPA